MEFLARWCSTSPTAQETCEKCGRGLPGHGAQTCNNHIADREREERLRAEQNQREERLVTNAAQTAARSASRRTVFMIFGGGAIAVLLLVVLVISATGNAKEEAGPSAGAGPTAAVGSAAPRPGIVIRPRHP